jgi:threonine synthase
MSTLHCVECTAVLDVAYNDSGSAAAIPSPLRRPKEAITLGEGNTPSVSLRNVSEHLSAEVIYAKLESMNPTGSFKDRGTAVMMSVAAELGVAEVVEDSSGNAGASVAAYAARAGIQAHIFAPASAPAAKLEQIAVYGAQAHLIEGDRQAVTDAATEFANRNSLVYASHNLSPFFTEGTKTFAYEIAKQFDGDPPRHIVIPVGNGSLLIGAYRGFREMLHTGRINVIPRLHAIQASAVMPLVSAFIDNSQLAPAVQNTIAGGIAVANPPRLRQCLRALRGSGGSAVAVEERDILLWQRRLAQREGVFIEPTSAAAFAGVEALVTGDKIRREESILVAATGFGLKDAIPPAQI